ncbi:hypothetical protein CDAR_128131 [Caerostris darwini]|uniref:Uncharacterized protein n=1 Tax=Caerostris darwini TaxID=1538125 RepID=A0AAV4VAK4_9ARAC|nr:hypothetical protein CDAR_128131 [Caerostris darwini]
MTSQLHPSIIHTVIVWDPPPLPPEKKRGADGADRGLMRCLRSCRRFKQRISKKRDDKGTSPNNRITIYQKLQHNTKSSGGRKKAKPESHQFVCA